MDKKRADIKKKKFIEAYEQAMCNITSACKVAGISRETYYNWRERDRDFEKKLIYAEESVLDFAETMLVKNIREGKETSLIFYLKTKGKKRGYIEQINSEVSINAFEKLMKDLEDE